MFIDFFTRYPFAAFVLGFIIALILIAAFVWHKKVNTLTKYFSGKNCIENVIIVTTVIVFVITIFGQIIFGQFDSAITTAVISTISTFLFSWLITKKVSATEYKEKLKEEASTAYRHNKSLLIKIEYEIRLIDEIFSNNICAKDNMSCEHLHTLFRIKDSLISFKRDSEENIGDWANIIAKEIDIINQIVALHTRRKECIYLRENVEDGQNSEGIDTTIATIDEDIDSLMNKFKEEDSIYRILLNNELKLTNDMDQWIRGELTAKNSRKIKRGKDYGVISDFVQQLENINEFKL